MRFALTIITALFLVGCGSPQPVAPTAQITPSSAPSGSGTKRIVQDGAGYILPDGTRVAAGERVGSDCLIANTSLCWQTVCCCPMACSVRRTAQGALSARDQGRAVDARLRSRSSSC